MIYIYIYRVILCPLMNYIDYDVPRMFFPVHALKKCACLYRYKKEGQHTFWAPCNASSMSVVRKGLQPIVLALPPFPFTTNSGRNPCEV